MPQESGGRRGGGVRGRKNGMLLIQFKKEGKRKGVFFFFEAENGLWKVETDSGNFDIKWPLAFREVLCKRKFGVLHNT